MMEVSLRLADIIVSFKVRKLTGVRLKKSEWDDGERIARREKNIKMVLDERERLKVKAMLNHFSIF